MKFDRTLSYNAEDLAKAFPDVDPGHLPFGSRVLVQLRRPKIRSKGGLILAEETIETEKWNTQIGKVLAIGPVAFCSRETLKPWPEGAWAKVGDYVRIPKFNQDKWEVEYEDDGKKELALFMFINDLDLIGKKTGNPLEVKAYV